MDADTIQKIAAEVAKNLPQHVWYLLAVQAVLVCLSAGIGAYFSEYLKTKGKNLATRHDFETLQAQLRENTELVENVKAEVGQKDWAAREWRNTRRTKLEEVLVKMHDCDEFADRFRTTSLEGVTYNERDPVGELETLGILYFPELKDEVFGYAAAHRQHIVAGSVLANELIRDRTDLAKREVHYAAYMSGYQDRLSATSVAQRKLNSAARRLLVQIVGIN
jgi:hypothetical protein